MSLDKNCQFTLGHWQKLKTGDDMRSQDENSREKKTKVGDQTSFLTLIWYPNFNQISWYTQIGDETKITGSN